MPFVCSAPARYLQSDMYGGCSLKEFRLDELVICPHPRSASLHLLGSFSRTSCTSCNRLDLSMLDGIFTKSTFIFSHVLRNVISCLAFVVVVYKVRATL